MIPAFVARVDQPDRGGRWIIISRKRRRGFGLAARDLLASVPPAASDEVTLTDFAPDGELKVVAAALYAHSTLPDAQLFALARQLSPDDRAALLRAYVGRRANRRHKPGRAFERTSYRFDVLTDYGAFRDLQRHRMLTLEWQPLSSRHGYTEPEAIAEAGAQADWNGDESVGGALRRSPRPDCRRSRLRGRDGLSVRFYMEMNAREALHVIELRTTPRDIPRRRVCQLMHSAIADVAGHRAIAAAMQFVDHSEVELERLQSERAMERNAERPRTQ